MGAPPPILFFPSPRHHHRALICRPISPSLLALSSINLATKFASSLAIFCAWLPNLYWSKSLARVVPAAATCHGHREPRRRAQPRLEHLSLSLLSFRFPLDVAMLKACMFPYCIIGLARTSAHRRVCAVISSLIIGRPLCPALTSNKSTNEVMVSS